MKITSALMIIAIAGLASSGCYTTVVRNADAKAAPATVEYDGKWHSGVVFGLAELSGPHDLAKICPNGWAEIETETGFVHGLVQMLTFNLYNPQRVTVRCNAGGAAPAAAPAEAPAGEKPAEAPPAEPPK